MDAARTVGTAGVDDALVPQPRVRPAAATGDETQRLEQRAAALADLVLKTTALADRYDRQPTDSSCAATARADSDARVLRLRTAAACARLGLQELLSAP